LTYNKKKPVYIIVFVLHLSIIFIFLDNILSGRKFGGLYVEHISMTLSTDRYIAPEFMSISFVLFDINESRLYEGQCLVITFIC